jgi:hypothetical protein
MITGIETKRLLDKYFEGRTSCEEEQQLRRFFAEGDVPEDLKIYRPIFACLDEESKHASSEKKHASHTLRIRYTWGAIAASLFIILGIAGYNQFVRVDDTNYVIINGKKYTDVNKAKQEAQKAFQEVSFSKEDIADLLPKDMKENLQ